VEEEDPELMGAKGVVESIKDLHTAALQNKYVVVVVVMMVVVVVGNRSRRTRTRTRTRWRKRRRRGDR